MRGFRAAAFTMTLMVGVKVFPAFGASDYLVHSPGITVELSRQGEIMNVVLGQERVAWPVLGRTSLAGCRVEGPVESDKKEGGGIRFKKRLACDIGGARKEVRLVEDFLPAKDSVRWEMELEGQGPPWSTAIETRLQFPNLGTKKFWTAWGDPQSVEIRAKRPPSAHPDWEDPLTLATFQDRKLWYGAPYYRYDLPYATLDYSDVFCIPLATVGDSKNDVGLSLALSPEDPMQDMILETSAQGDVTFSRLFRRISAENPARFDMDLIAHEADWRGGLRWMSKRYAEYFNPVLASADELGGTAAYSSFEGDLDVAKFKRMAFTVNWKACFDFPYQGMFLPPVTTGDQEWLRGYPAGEFPHVDLGLTTTVSRVAAYPRRMRKMGFYVLNYFDVLEFGKGIVYPPPPPKRKPSDPDLWKDPNDFLYAKLADAILFPPPKEVEYREALYGKAADTGPRHPFWGEVLMDPGEPSWQNFLLDQARRLIEKVPDASGIGLDVLAFLRLYNGRRDDGVSWYDGPVASFIYSWNDMLNKLGPLEHAAGQVVFADPVVEQRIDILRQVDGLFDEYGTFGPNRNNDALLGIFKPTIGWVAQEKDIWRDLDTFLQTYLYLGVFPMAPFPQNDHSILPSASADKIYMDYGPLFEALRGRKWVLLPHVISVEGEGVKANLFQIPSGYLFPVTFGGSAPNARVTIRGIPEILAGKGVHCELIHPGDMQWTACECNSESRTITTKVPLHRGCAVVRLHVE
jgi:hypothetical protein